MKGWLIVNGFLQSEKFQELTQLFIQAARREGIELAVISNTELSVDTGKQLAERPDFALFWDKDVILGEYLEQAGIRLYNTSACVRVCDDKRLTHLALRREKIPAPRTVIAPMTYANIGFTDLDFLDRAGEELSFPLVMKEAFGSFGEQVYLIHDREQLRSRVKNSAATALLFQEYIADSHGRDVRLQVVGERVVAAMYRFSEQDFRANITAGGQMRAYHPTEEECALALRAARAAGADFAGVDLLFGPEGPLVCEVNSNAHFKNLLDCTGTDVAEKIIQYIRKDLLA